MLHPSTGFSARKRGARGFTIIEIAVVLLVIAILAAVITPQVVSYMRKYRLGVASRNVATALQRARYLATSNNTRVGIAISQTRKIEIEQYDLEGNNKPQSKGLVLLPEGITISKAAPKTVAFDGRGLVTPMPRESPEIQVNGEKGFYMVVTVSPTGQVTVSGVMRDDE